jgi:hypothetical protein
MPFKGGSRVWSNRYFFDGGAPSDDTHWHTLMDNVTAAEKLVHSGGTVIGTVWGYNAGSEVPVSTKVYSLAGTNAGAGSSIIVPGECTALVRYSTASRTTKNHPIYLFNYYHHTYGDSTSQSTIDKVAAATKTLLSTFAAAWISGFSDGTVTHHRCGPHSQLATGHVEEEYLTHRDFPYTTSV